MTSGTQTKGSLLPQRARDWLTNQPATSLGGTYGSRILKTWNGGDSFPSRKSSRTPKRPLSSALVQKINDKKGIEIFPEEEIFYDGNLVKGRRGLSPNSWTCSFVTNHHPEGNALFRREVVATGAVYDYYGWLSVSWDSLYSTNVPPVPVLTPSDEYKLISRLSNQIRGNDFNASVAASQSMQALNMIGGTVTRIAKSIRAVKSGRLVDAWDNLVRDRHAKLNRQKMFEIRRELRIREYLNKLPNGDILDRRKSVPKWLRTTKSQDLLDRVRLDRRRDFDRSLDSVSSDWLAMQYGWLPLYSDVHGALELFAHQQERSFLKTYRASITRKVNLSNVFSHQYPGPKPNYYDFKTATASISKRVIVEIEAKPSVASILGLQNPLSVAWELMPWSFVVDWFIPIGDYLQATADVRMLNVKRVVTTTKTVSSVSGPVFKTSISGSLRIVPFQQTGFGGFRREETRFERSVSASLPSTPLPTFKPLSETFSFRRAANAVALFRLFK